MATLRLVPASGEPFEVKGDSALVGREPACDLVVSDGSVSRKHARLERRDATWIVLDQGSANGTFLDSQRVAEATLRPGQQLRFGTVTFGVEIEDEDSGTVAAYLSPDSTVVAAPHEMPTPALGMGIPSPTAGGPPTAPAKPSPPPAEAPPPPLPKPAMPTVAPRPVAAVAQPRKAPATSPLPPSGPGREPGPRPAAAPVGQMPAPPLETKGRSPLFWVVTGCCGCLLLGVLILTGIVGTLFFAGQAPANAVQSHLAELRRGDLDAAYRKLSRDLQAKLPPEEFQRLINEHPGLRDNKDATFWNRSVSDGRARLSGILTPRSGDTEQATFELAKEEGEWRITSIRVGREASD